jgi:predicted enzyme related to lactoylglutathione lyase
MNNLTHFEIPAKDIKRAQKFYAGLFDWEFQLIEEMNYLMFQTKNAEGKNAGSGGILEPQNGMHVITNYINVVNIDESAAKVTRLGGKIIIPKSPVPGMGWFVHFMDTEGNAMALFQNDNSAK